MVNEMVERHARAHYAAERPGLEGVDFPAWDELREDTQDQLLHASRAAIEAMREPTEAMVEYAEYETEHTIEGVGSDYPDRQTQIGNFWRNMIDAALADLEQAQRRTEDSGRTP